MIKAVIFDNDGVLIDSEPLHIETDIQVLSLYGVKQKQEDLHRFIGVKDSDMWPILISEFNLSATTEELLEHKSRIRKNVFTAEHVSPICGIPELFSYIREAGLKIAVASSSSKALVAPLVSAMGLMGYLDALVAGEDVTNGKPHPESYLLAAKLLGVLPSECVAIEDSSFGVASAKAAGCICIGFASVFAPKQDLSAADHIVTDIRAIISDNLLGLKKDSK